MQYLIFILLLAALIVVHELGHFAAAKLARIRVDEFGIGFPPRILGIKWGETTYTLNLLFFGGFVRIHGEEGSGAHDKHSFAARSRWTQAAVVVAGICMNLVFAWLILFGAFLTGLPAEVTPDNAAHIQHPQVTVLATIPGSPAENAGLKPNDIIERMSAGGARTAPNASSDDMRAFVAAHQNSALTLTLLRGGEETTVSARPASGLVPDSAQKYLGVEFTDIGILHAPLPQAFTGSVVLAAQMTKDTAVGLAQFFGGLLVGHADLTGIAGPVGIVQVGASAVAQGAPSALFLTALISINLALLNVLPIPGLDGGRLAVISVEGARRKPVSVRTQTRLIIGGYAFLALLMVLVTYHDIFH